jgi:hypothetical protein
MVYAYHSKNCLNKKFARMLEEEILKKELQDGENIEIEKLALIVNVYCTSRSGSRDFQKLLEMTVL